MDNMLKDFLVESYENLDQADQDFVALEQTPDNLETLASIFRTIHTIKGSCGFFGFSHLETLAHTGENLLGLLREGQLRVNDEITTALLDMIDHIREALAAIEEDGQEDGRDFATVIATLKQLQVGNAATAVDIAAEELLVDTSVDSLSPPVLLDEPEVAPGGPILDDIVRKFINDSYACLDRMDAGFLSLGEEGGNSQILEELASAAETLADGCEFMGLARLVELIRAGEKLLEELRTGVLEWDDKYSSALLDMAVAISTALVTIESTGDDGDEDVDTLRVHLQELSGGREQVSGGAAADQPVEPVAVDEENKTSNPDSVPVDPTAVPEPAKEPAKSVRTNTIADNTIRVDVGLLDLLMNQVGELVLARNQILQRTNGAADKEMTTMYQRLNHITSELQESIMLTRLQPIDTIWSKLPRVVRDLSREVDKQIQLVMEGGDTELDKTLIEMIKDPITHLVRNAVDHGIESPEDRLAVGKKARGTVTLRAYHEGGQVNIEILDDGKGIDGDKVVEKVLEKKLLEPEIVRNLSERDKFGLIFLPGLSTADSVTNISGRGVGMDVVKSNIDRINGLIDIQSELGRGTHIKLKIPLTLAIIPALMVNCDNERYAIPQMSLISVVSGDTAREGIEVLHHVPVYRWRGKLLPLVYLRDELKLGQSVGENDPISIIILQAENREFGLIVDEVNDTEEIVVKPLGKYLRSIPIYAGATILGDGMAALILDVLGLAQSAAVVSELGGSEYGVIEEEVQEVDFDKQMVLLVRHNGSGMAIPVSRVPRLEKIAYKSIEYSGETPVVQYRGSILRLKMLQGGALEASESKSESMLNVVVCSEEGGLVGVVVDEIVDIVEEHFTIQPNGIRKNGILGTAVIHEKVVEVVDVDMLSSGLY